MSSSTSTSQILLLLLLGTLLPLTIAHTHEPQCGWGIPPNPLVQLPQCISLNTLGSSPPSWAPWTHRPYCIPSFAAPLCVFTNAALPRPPLGDQRGISIITTPALASDLDLYSLPLERAFTYPPVATNMLLSPYDEPFIEVRDIPGKGRGVVATRRIEKDRVIMVDHVSVLAASEYPADVLREEVRDLLREAVGRLGEPRRVRGLAGRKEDGRRGRLSLEEGIVSTNSFELPVRGQGYMGLFVELSVSDERKSKGGGWRWGWD